MPPFSRPPGAPGPRTHLGGLRDLPRRHHSGHPQRVDRGRDERCYATGYGGSCGRPVTWCEPLWGMMYSCLFMFILGFTLVKTLLWYDRPKDYLWLLQTLQKNFTEMRFGGSQAVESGPALPRKWRVVGLGNGIAFQRRLGPRGIPSALSISCSLGSGMSWVTWYIILYIYISIIVYYPRFWSRYAKHVSLKFGRFCVREQCWGQPCPNFHCHLDSRLIGGATTYET